MKQIERWPEPPRRRHRVKWRGNVAHVLSLNPHGYGMVEVAPSVWALAWRTRSTAKPFTTWGAPRAIVQAELEKMQRENRRPIFPPIALLEVHSHG